MSAVLIVAACVLYAMIAGGVVAVVHPRSLNSCPEHRSVDREYACCMRFHAGESVAAGLFWPAALPIMFGMSAAKWLMATSERRESKHQKRMAELAAQEQLLRTNIEFLKANGVNADYE